MWSIIEFMTFLISATPVGRRISVASENIARRLSSISDPRTFENSLTFSNDMAIETIEETAETEL